MRIDIVIEHAKRERGARREWRFDAPIEDRPWRVGCLVGPHAAGKSTLMAHLFGPKPHPPWWGRLGHNPRPRAVLSYPPFAALPQAQRRDVLDRFELTEHMLEHAESLGWWGQRLLCMLWFLDDQPLLALDEELIDDDAHGRAWALFAAAVRAHPNKQVVFGSHPNMRHSARQPDEIIGADWIIEPLKACFRWRSS